MGFITAWITRAIIASFALFYGAVVCARLAFATVFKPSKKFWFVKQRDAPPKCLSDPAYGSHKYIKLKDIKLHYVEKGDNTKPLVLFVHGFPEFWYSWRYQLKEFSKDYWTVALDMRGYGDSDKPSGSSNYRIFNMVNDLKELVEGLGRKKFILVAHDWGGVVAWQFLYSYPEMVDKFIIMDAPHPRGLKKYILSHTKQFFMSWYIFFFQLPYLPEILMKSYDMVTISKMLKGEDAKTPASEEDTEAYKYTYAKPGAFTGPINYYRANMIRKAPKKLEEDLPPGMLIFGENDLYLSRDLMDLAKSFVPHLRLEVVKDANHFVQQDDPETVNKLLRSFLKT